MEIPNGYETISELRGRAAFARVIQLIQEVEFAGRERLRAEARQSALKTLKDGVHADTK